LVYFIVLSLGLALGILICAVMRPALFTKGQSNFQSMELMFEQFMEELEVKQEAWRQEYQRAMEEMERLKTADEERVSPTGNVVPLQGKANSETAGPPVNQWAHQRRSPRTLSSTRTKQVFDLAEQQLQPEDIAKELQMGKGEVELILQLKMHRSST